MCVIELFSCCKKLNSWQMVEDIRARVKMRTEGQSRKDAVTGRVVKNLEGENQDGGVGRHTAPPHTTRTDRESNSKGD